MAPRSPRSITATTAALAAALGGLLGACTGSGGGGSAAALCSVLGDGRSYTALFEQGFDPTDTQRALAQLEAAGVDLDQLRDAAPDDVRGAIDDERTYLDAVAAVIGRVGADDPAAVVAGINALTEERAAAEVASLELRAFEQASCRTSTTAG